MLKKILLFLFAAFVIIQFFHPDKNIDNNNLDGPKDISYVFAMPDNVQDILQRSCYDCHSNNTDYPWYAEIQPVGWWLNHHIDDGKKEVNFNEFSNYTVKKQYKKLEEIIEQVKKGEMPLSSYILIHKNAELTREQQVAVTSWASASIDSLKAHYPADSFLRKN